jgi:rhamnosyltransferase subunit B
MAASADMEFPKRDVKPSMNQPLKILIAALGSHGDIHPFLGIAKTLRNRGHHVIFIAPAMYAALVEKLGFEFVGVGTEEQFQRFAANPDMWHPIRGVRVVCAGTIELLEPYFTAIADRYEPGKTVSVLSTLALGGRIAQDKLGIPTVSVHLSPAIFRSVEQPARLGPVPIAPWQPMWFKKLIFEIIDEFILDPLLAPGVNEFRSALGLPPVEKFFATWGHSPQRVIGLFPDWFAPPPPDWPPQTVLTGFPLYDEADVTPMDDRLEKFLAAGQPPIAFTPGSAMRHGHEFFEVAVNACKKLNRRGLLVSLYDEHFPHNLPPEILQVKYAPFSRLLPRCAAVVHHAGIGTSAQSLAAGIPQLPMPMTHDQPDNAARLEKLGVARTIPAYRFTVSRAAAALDELIRNPSYANAGKLISQRLRQSDALTETAQWIESTAEVTDVA